MTPHVMKRDGCKVPFKSERIKEAILRAAKAAEVDDADYCATHHHCCRAVVSASRWYAKLCG